jgi:hypothetical protein
MAERLGIVRRYQHFVLDTTGMIKADDWEIGYIAVCGALAIFAYDDYLARLPLCPSCLGASQQDS